MTSNGSATRPVEVLSSSPNKRKVGAMQLEGVSKMQDRDKADSFFLEISATPALIMNDR